MSVQKRLFAVSVIAAALTVASANAATIVAHVLLHTAAPPMKVINTASDQYCAMAHKTNKLTAEEVLPNPNGTLRNAFVFVSEGVTGSYAAPKTPVILDQVGCHYTPHTFGVMAGQPIIIRNSDSTLHNIHPMPKVNTPFNIGMPLKGMSQTRVFPKPERPFHVKCDVHPWMSGYIGVFTNPFFGISNDQGVVEIANLPAGTYTIESYQEKFGYRTQKLTVGANDRKEIDFTY